MNTVRTLLLLALFAAATVSATAQEAKAPPPNKAGDLIEKAVEALGGAGYLGVTQFIREGRLYSFSRGQLASPGTLFTEYVKLPYKSRVEFGRKNNIIYVNNGDQGWELDPQGIRDQTPEAIADFKASVRRDMDFLLRTRRTEPGMQFYYLGSEFIDNRRMDIIEMVDAENESLQIYLDAQTHLPGRLRYRERDTLTGEMVEVVEYYGTYLTFQGIRTPRQITRERVRLRTFEAFILKVNFHADVPDPLFTREALEEIWGKTAKKQKKKKKDEEN